MIGISEVGVNDFRMQASSPGAGKRGGAAQGSTGADYCDMSDLLDDIDAVIWEADPRTFAFTYVSKGAERLLGYPATTWTSEPDFWPRHIHPDDRSAAVALCEAATNQGLDHDFEYRMIAADGSTRWVRDLVRVSTNHEGKVTRLRGILYDKTAGRRADEARSESDQCFHALFQSMLAGVATLTLDGQVVSCNRAAAEMLGYGEADLVGQSVLELAHPDEQAQAAAVLESLARGEGRAVQYEARYIRRDGRTVTTLLGGSRVDRESGPPYIVLQLLDISVRKALELELHQSRKLEAIGRLAGGVAHDFNNLLTVMGAYIEFLANDFHTGDVRRADLEELRNAVVAGRELTQSLLAFSRQQPIEPKIVGLNSRITTIQRLLNRLIQDDVSVTTLLTPEPLNIQIDPGQLEQMMINLVINARDAMPDGGRLTIATRLVTVDANAAASIPMARPGRYAVITVNDTGVGMNDATRRRIFEPFFTTKPSGKGTGFGLATVYGIAHQNGGFVSVDSAPGQGASFKVYLPLFEGSSEEAHESAAP
jgi:PAS domain S-box-containing protein